jgi:hypothetical protein
MVAMAACLSLALSGCLTNDWANQELTTSQRELRSQSDRFAETVVTGTAAGAFIGCALGAVIVGVLTRDGEAARGACVGGGAAGAVVGAGSGYLVASRNRHFASVEEAAQARLDAARKEADDLARVADAATRVARENEAALAALEGQLRQRLVTAERYRAIVAAMRTDVEAMQRARAGTAKAVAAMEVEGASDPAIREQAERGMKSRKDIDDAIATLEAALARVVPA